MELVGTFDKLVARMRKRIVESQDELEKCKEEVERLRLMLLLNKICYKCGGKVLIKHRELIIFSCENCGFLRAYSEEYLNHLMKKHGIRREI